MTLDRWKGKTALVTGVSSGIGTAIARRLVLAGLTVVAGARRTDRLEALHAELGDALVPIALDVTDESSVQNAVQLAVERSGDLSVLVNNAGLGYMESLLSGSTARWREMLEVNVLGLCVCTREAVRAMRETGGEGHVIHIGSLSGHRVPPGSNMYGATKFAVRSLTESLRTELNAAGLPIRVTAVSPGFVETEFHQKFYGSEKKSAEIYDRFKVLEPSDVADAVAYALGTPPHVQVHDVLIRPTAQPT